MRQYNVAGIRPHLDHLQLGVVKYLAALHKPIHASISAIGRTQRLDPWTSADQRPARICRLEPRDVFLARQTVNKPMRPRDKKSAAAPSRQTCQTCKDPHTT